MAMKLNHSKTIGESQEPYFIAEINSSHNGNMEMAKNLVKAAFQAGCDCAKFQSWTPDTLYSKTFYMGNPIAKRIVQKFSLSQDQLRELADYCRETGIDFSSTPYSEPEVDWLIELNVPFIKISSMEINNYGFLRYAASTKVPIILS